MAELVRQFLGNYRLSVLLGHGGFAQVYQAEHIYLKTPAAIKVLRMQMVSEAQESFFSDFLHEARIIAGLEHPNIVRVLEFGIDLHTPYLVMSYAPNGTLRQRHPRGTTLSATTILPYIKQIAAALQYAHDRKLIHRDVKPENMLLGDDNQVLLSDFGLAVVSQSANNGRAQDMAGTIAYMAPEQLQGKACQASDQYALGVVVYEWLSGTWPFNGLDLEIALQHAQCPPPPLHEKVVTISPAVEQVVVRALAKDPSQRFSSVQDFAHAFEQACIWDPFFPSISTQGSSAGDDIADPEFLNTPMPPAFTPGPHPMPVRRPIFMPKPVSTPLTFPPIPPITDRPSPLLLPDTTLAKRPQRVNKRRLTRRRALAGIAGIAAMVATGRGLSMLIFSSKTATTSSSPDQRTTQASSSIQVSDGKHRSIPTHGSTSTSAYGSSPGVTPDTTPTATPSIQPDPTQGQGQPLTVQIVHPPLQVINNTLVSINVTTSEGNVNVVLLVSYNTPPQKDATIHGITDQNGHATLSWLVQVSNAQHSNTMATLMVMATDQDGQKAQAGPLTIQVAR